MSNESGKVTRSAAGASPARTGKAAVRRFKVGGKTVEVPVSRSKPPHQRQVDVCFVFDTTGSMSSKLDGLVNCMSEFVGELAQLQLDWRVTAVPFGDLLIGERIVDDLPFVSTRDAAQQLLQHMERFSGGGNGGESSLEAVQAALRKDYRDDAIKVLVVLTDEPPHEVGGLTVGRVGQMIRQGEFICFVAAPHPRVQGPRVEGFKQWAHANGGRWYPIRQTMPTDKILEFLRSLVQEIPRIVHKALEAGSVRRYLELESGNS
jgi:hypothetical protein